MTFLAPGFFYASLAVAAAVVALHFIVTRQPRAGVLPTARFIPDMPATATARATRPSDLLLMLLRVALVLAAGLGLAKPVLKPTRSGEARVILADLSRSSNDSTALRDSVRVLYRDRDVLIVFDSSARTISTSAGDSIGQLKASDTRGNLSAAFIAAMRAASALREKADSIELVVVSPFAAEEFDAATRATRSLWPGGARLVRIATTADTASISGDLDIRAGASDPLRTTLGFVQKDSLATAVINRVGSPVLDAAGRAVVDWPVNGRPRFAAVRARPDTIGAVTGDNSLVVSGFERRWAYPADSIRDADVIARWVDGEPAAIEKNSADGCVRSVAIPVNPIGDLVIRPDFIALVSALSGNCIARTSLIPANPEEVNALAGNGKLAPRAAFRPKADVRSAIAPWLIALAIALAFFELIVRRQKVAAVARERSRGMKEARAA